ncbi:MAG: PP2C family protein-serine/threonine phosphatase [Candidatus Babeliaceae bacterium]
MKKQIFLLFLVSTPLSIYPVFSYLKSWFKPTELTDIFYIYSEIEQGGKENQEDVLLVPETKDNKSSPFITTGVFDGHGPGALFWFNDQKNKKLINLCVKEKLISPIQHPEGNYACTGQNAAEWFKLKVDGYITQNLLGWKSWIYRACCFKKDFGAFAIEKACVQAQQEYAQKIAALAEIAITPGQSERTSVKKDPGTTCALITLYKNFLYCSHVGDSRTLIIKPTLDELDRGLVYASIDHVPKEEHEKERLKKSNAVVKIIDGVRRIGGILAASRSLGNVFLAKKGLIAQPTIKKVPLDQIETIISSTDGLLENLSSLYTRRYKIRKSTYESSRQQNVVLIDLVEEYTQGCPRNFFIEKACEGASNLRFKVVPCDQYKQALLENSNRRYADIERLHDNTSIVIGFRKKQRQLNI